MVSRAFQLEEFIFILESWGLTDVLIPFMLIFVIVFATLQKTRILGEDKKRFNAIFSLSIALLVVIPHVLGTYPPDADIIDIMNKAIPNVSIIVVAIIMLLIIVGVLGGERNWTGGSLSGWLAISAFIIIIWVFGAAAGWWIGWIWFNDFFGADTIAVVIMILVFAIIVWWITKGDAEEKAGALGRIGNSFRDFFGKK